MAIKAKAAKPARRKTAKKQGVGRLTKMEEIALLMAPLVSNQKEADAVVRLSKVGKRPVSRKGNPKKVDASKLEGRLLYGVSKQEDREVLVHRAKERRAELITKGAIVMPRKAKKVAIKLNRKVRAPKQQLVRPRLVHNHRILIEGSLMSPEKAAEREAHLRRLYTFSPAERLLTRLVRAPERKAA